MIEFLGFIDSIWSEPVARMTMNCLLKCMRFTGCHIGATGGCRCPLRKPPYALARQGGVFFTTTFEKESSLFRERCKPSFQPNRFEGDRQHEAYSGRRLIDGQFRRPRSNGCQR
jgi:hypothetical protein